MNKFYIVYPNDNVSPPFDNYVTALAEAKIAAERVGIVVITWLYHDGAPAAHIVQSSRNVYL